MGALSERWRVFQTALGHKRYMLADVAKLAVVIIAAVLMYWFRRDMTWLEIIAVGVAVFGWLAAWLLLEHAFRLTRQISDGRMKISKLRHKGVDIRNRGRFEITDEASWLKWEKEAEAWNKRVVREMRRISEADAEWFRILDVVPKPRLNPEIAPTDHELKAEFLRLYQMHDFRVARLGDMIRDLWGNK